MTGGLFLLCVFVAAVIGGIVAGACVFVLALRWPLNRWPLKGRLWL